MDEVLEAAGCRQQRARLLPARVVVYSVPAMGLFPDCGYRRVWAALTAGRLRGMVADPSAAALRQARQRLGVKPLSLLFDQLREAVGTAVPAGVFWHGLRLVAWDGTCLEVADRGLVENLVENPMADLRPGWTNPLVRRPGSDRSQCQAIGRRRDPD
ncbi:transposase domain-containing protein [Streptomyces sp. NPDC094472]|uniref:transposase domain-containing protein n=1 Tax=Streptomyces sp. NPDC094472 TaxID=3155080 RepID=UPI0033269A88